MVLLLLDYFGMKMIDCTDLIILQEVNMMCACPKVIDISKRKPGKNAYTDQPDNDF